MEGAAWMRVCGHTAIEEEYILEKCEKMVSNFICIAYIIAYELCLLMFST